VSVPDTVAEHLTGTMHRRTADRPVWPANRPATDFAGRLDVPPGDPTMRPSECQDTTTSLAANRLLFTAAAPLVLIVDDEEATRDLLADVLQCHGYRVSRANDGAEALDKVRYLAPSVILMDLCLPHLTGVWPRADCGSTRAPRTSPSSS